MSSKICKMIIPWQRRKWESRKICFHLIAARNNTIKFINKPLSNIGLLHWVKPLGIKYFRGIYSCDILPEILVQSEYPAGKRFTPNDNLISWLWTIIRTIVGTVLSLNLQLIIAKWAKPKKRWSTGTRKMATIFSWVIDYDLITKTIHDYMEGVRVPCKFCNREFLSKETPKIHYKIIHWIEKKIVPPTKKLVLVHLRETLFTFRNHIQNIYMEDYIRLLSQQQSLSGGTSFNNYVYSSKC